MNRNAMASIGIKRYGTTGERPCPSFACLKPWLLTCTALLCGRSRGTLWADVELGMVEEDAVDIAERESNSGEGSIVVRFCGVVG